MSTPFETIDRVSRVSRKKPNHLRTTATTTAILFTLTILFGLIWNWSIALVFIISAGLFTLCCFLSYYCRATFFFNNIPDTNQSGFLALVTNHIARANSPHSHSEQETLQPFTFKDQETAQEAEDRVVRALLRQVFPDE